MPSGHNIAGSSPLTTDNTHQAESRRTTSELEKRGNHLLQSSNELREGPVGLL